MEISKRKNNVPYMQSVSQDFLCSFSCKSFYYYYTAAKTHKLIDCLTVCFTCPHDVAGAAFDDIVVVIAVISTTWASLCRKENEQEKSRKNKRERDRAQFTFH